MQILKKICCIFVILEFCAGSISLRNESQLKASEDDSTNTQLLEIPQYSIPEDDYYPTLSSNIPENVYDDELLTNNTDSRVIETSLESRTIPFLLNFIILPKLIFKFTKAVAFVVSVATTLGVMFFVLSATICTFTPICVLGLAIPGLRNVERAGRGLVQQISENVPGEKIEAGIFFQNLFETLF